MLSAKRDGYTVAVVGATGAVGREMVSVLEERKFRVRTIKLLASERSLGERIEFMGYELPVEILTESSFQGVDIALFSAGEAISLKFAPIAVRAGAVVIDNSAAFRMDPEVPLVVPEVNPQAISGHRGIIANPNCSTIQLVVVLKPIHDLARIQRAVVTTFQSVSGKGKEAMDELMEQTRAILAFQDVRCEVFPAQIAFNCLPQIDQFTEDGYTKEEMKLLHETRKIMGDNTLQVTATTVRVPVMVGHSESVNIQTERPLSPNEARAVLAGAPGVLVFDDPSKNVYPTPLDVSGKDEVYVGRVREDRTIPNGLNLWIVADNLRKGAALNAVQIAERLVADAE
ncbi:MAG: aspartate-semialdehyde dehydrogenase [Nitrospirae bacterium]|nr:aspartate-semialdehyde dehydrogenase [Nitrospirota bacterium]